MKITFDGPDEEAKHKNFLGPLVGQYVAGLVEGHFKIISFELADGYSLAFYSSTVAVKGHLKLIVAYYRPKTKTIELVTQTMLAAPGTAMSYFFVDLLTEAVKTHCPDFTVVFK